MNKEQILQFYQSFFNEHQLDSADAFISVDYIQHSPGVSQGLLGVKKAFAKRFADEPDFQVEVERIVQDGAFAAVFLTNTSASLRVVDLYRIENGQLAEHWDYLDKRFMKPWQQPQRHNRI